MLAMDRFGLVVAHPMKTGCTYREYGTRGKQPWSARSISMRHRLSLPDNDVAYTNRYHRAMPIRHPYDRLSSFYWYCVGGAAHGMNFWQVDYWIKHIDSPHDWVAWFLNEAPQHEHWCFKLHQYHARFKPEYLFEYRHFNTLLAELDIPKVPLKEVNVSKQRTAPWYETFDPGFLKAEVFPHYEKDFELTGYLPDQHEHPDNSHPTYNTPVHTHLWRTKFHVGL